jgi:hypothetical protein
MHKAIVHTTSSLPFQCLFKAQAIEKFQDFIGTCLALGAKNITSSKVGEFSGTMNTVAFETEAEMLKFVGTVSFLVSKDDVLMFRLV